MKKIILIAALAVSIVSGSECENPKNNFDSIYCLNKVYIQTDKNLNESYSALRKHLYGQERYALLKSQREWIEVRNDECSLSKNGMFYVNLRCTTDVTRKRTEFLNNRLTECKSGAGCMKSKLIEIY